MTLSVHVPGSKSFTNRHLVLAGMCTEESELSGALFADDTINGMKCLRSLGFSVTENVLSGKIHIVPPKVSPSLDFARLPSVQSSQNLQLFEGSEFFCDFGQAGTLARFFPAVALNYEKIFGVPADFRLDASEQLQKRPLAELLIALEKLGATTSAYSLPLNLKSWQTVKSEVEISGNKSGQFLSGLLLAAAGTKQKIKILRQQNLVQPDYVRMTIQSIHEWSNKLNESIFFDENLTEFDVFLPHGFSGGARKIEADASTACYFVCAALFHNRNLVVENLGCSSLQPDVKFLQMLSGLGAPILVKTSSIEVSSLSSSWRLPSNLVLDFSEYSDQALTMAAFAHCSESGFELTEIGHIRHHESDRLLCLHENLTRIGVHSEISQTGIKVWGSGVKTAKIANGHSILTSSAKIEWRTHHDHRMAMSAYLHKIFLPHISIENPSCVSKTCPSFFEMMANLF